MKKSIRHKVRFFKYALVSEETSSIVRISDSLFSGMHFPFQENWSLIKRDDKKYLGLKDTQGKICNYWCIEVL